MFREMSIDFDSLESKIGYKFKNKSLLQEALTHSSYAAENGTSYYERLEFMGDSVLNFIISDYLCDRYPNKKEGQLSSMRSNITCNYTLADVSKCLNLGNFMRFGRGEAMQGGKIKPSILCDVFEALLAAIYKDGGLEAAKQFIYTHLLPRIQSDSYIPDPKGYLQNICQQLGYQPPFYCVISKTGPAHDPTFIVQVEACGGLIIAEAEGKNRKEAEKNAAVIAIHLLFKLKHVMV